MNVETGEVKEWGKLTEEEKKCGKWFQLPNGDQRFIQELSKSEMKRREYMERVKEKKLAGENV